VRRDARAHVGVLLALLSLFEIVVAAPWIGSWTAIAVGGVMFFTGCLIWLIFDREK
jgi:hypothetical protein